MAMIRASEILLSAMLAAGFAIADDPPEPLLSPPPSFVQVGDVQPAKGLLKLIAAKTIFEDVKYRVPVVVLQDGVKKTVFEERTTRKPRIVTEEMEARGDNLQVLDGAGRKLEVGELWKRVKKGDTVLVVHDVKIDPVWLRVVKPEATILVLSLTPAKPS
jgi:hypothetical protein